MIHIQLDRAFDGSDKAHKLLRELAKELGDTAADMAEAPEQAVGYRGFLEEQAIELLLGGLESRPCQTFQEWAEEQDQRIQRGDPERDRFAA